MRKRSHIVKNTANQTSLIEWRLPFFAFHSALFTRLLLTVLLVLKLVTATAQQYPVQGSLIITPPYPAHLGDYANPAMEKLILQLTSTDITLANLRVRMKLSIYKGSSLLATSAGVIINEPDIVLDGGVPYRLTSAELAVYYKLENLQGITPNAWTQTLPEGAYTITFQVFDYYTGNKLNGDVSQQFWLLLNDPPLLNTPLDKENIQQSSTLNPQIVFQWTPRTTQVSNTEYEFTLVELWDDNADPYQQFLASAPKYKITTPQTTLLYGITEPPLIAGRRYAWRVQAKAKQGMEDIGLFRNEGYSNIYSFKYAGQCDAIQLPTGQVKGSDRIYLEWQQPSSFGGVKVGAAALYKIAYRKYSTSKQWEWVEMETSNKYINLTNLDPDTEYEIKAGNVCTNSLVGYSQPLRLRTQKSGTDLNVNCGQAPTIDLSNQTLLQQLNVYDVVMATDFPVTITRSEGNANGWNGEGWVKVPYLADTKIHVLFTQIKVNTDYRLIDGWFETAYNPNGSEISDIDETISNVKGIINDLKDLAAMAVSQDARDIAKLTQAIKEQAAQEMPPALLTKMNKALDAVNEAKQEYDQAKQEYDNAPTPAKKEAAKKKLDAAGEKFSKAMDDVKAVQKEQGEMVKGVIKIVLNAIKNIKKEKEKEISSVKAYTADIAEAVKALKESQDVDVKNDTQATEEENILLLDNYSENTPYTDDSRAEFLKKADDVMLKQKKAMSAAVYKAFTDFFANEQTLEAYFSKDEKLSGATLIEELIEKQLKGEAEEALVKHAKDYLQKVLEAIIEKQRS